MVSGAVGHNLERDCLGTIQGKVGIIWFGGSRGEDLI